MVGDLTPATWRKIEEDLLRRRIEAKKAAQRERMERG